MKRRIFHIVYSTILISVLFFGCHSSRSNHEYDLSDRVTQTFQELYPDDGWEVVGKLKASRMIQSFSDSEGNQILFHTIQATELLGVVEDECFYRAVIDPVYAETTEPQMVGAHDAVLYAKDGRRYLCWRPEKTVALILDYDPAAVSDLEILRMAESTKEIKVDAD